MCTVNRWVSGYLLQRHSAELWQLGEWLNFPLVWFRVSAIHQGFCARKSWACDRWTVFQTTEHRHRVLIAIVTVWPGERINRTSEIAHPNHRLINNWTYLETRIKPLPTLNSWPTSASWSTGLDFVSRAAAGISVYLKFFSSSHIESGWTATAALHERICCCSTRFNLCWLRRTCRHKC